MSRQVHRLILEVLKSRPPTRDVQSYLNTFGRRSERPRPNLFSPGSAQSRAPLPQRLSPSTSESLPFPEDAAYRHSSNLSKDATAVADRVTEDQEVASLGETHAALVKLQGPFSERQLFSIAEGLAYLKQLGLACVVVLDHDGWLPHARYGPDGKLVKNETPELAPWLGARPSDEHAQALECGMEESGLRNSIVRELWRVASIFTRAGLESLPLAHAMMRLVPTSRLPLHMADAQGVQDAPAHRAPLAADCTLHDVFRALDLGQTPLLIPFALYDEQGRGNQSELGALRTVCVNTDDVMVALAWEMVHAGGRVQSERAYATDLTPVRLLVISREGGIPSHARGGNPHLSINLQSEYASIRSSFVWNDTHPTALTNLDMIRDCLACMPRTSSGVMVTHRSPRSLIANLITNKAAHSPSLPQRLLAGRQDVRHTPTVLRWGLPVRVLSRWADVDCGKLQALLEKSFRRPLNCDAYFARLERHLDFLIVTGDYEGLALVSNEYAPDDAPDAEPIAYLDKFAVLPKLQGSGAVDFLWGALRDEVHGLGVLDALNHNGGKNGVGVGRDLVWKSRAVNPVNRWYFERSNGFVRLPPAFGLAPGAPVPDTSAWVLFWCDAEQRLAQLEGRNVPSSSTHLDDVREQADPVRSPLTPLSSARFPSETLLPIVAREECGRLARWERCLAAIPSAWL